MSDEPTSPPHERARMTRPGRLVLLNGTSSSGKTSLATRFRDLRTLAGEYWMLIGIDDFLSKLPADWLDLGLPSGRGPYATDGLRFEQADDGMALRMGPVCRNLLRSYRAAVAAAVRSGLNVIVDDVVIDADCWADWLAEIGDLNPVWAAVKCSPEVAVERELARGDRPLGMTSTQTDTVHRFPNYALEIDTTHLGPDEAFEQLRRHLTV